LDVVGASVRPHDFDSLRFDVVMNDQMFYLRAGTTEERDAWVSSLLETKVGAVGVLLLAMLPVAWRGQKEAVWVWVWKRFLG
jgi:hypothetical protein